MLESELEAAREIVDGFKAWLHERLGNKNGQGETDSAERGTAKQTARATSEAFVKLVIAEPTDISLCVYSVKVLRL